jgi:hypothetical protein
LNPNDLAYLNGYSVYPSYLTIGQVLNIPPTGVWPTSIGPRQLLPHPTNYTPSVNETVNFIACKYGDVYPEGIKAVNNLSIDLVPAGRTVKIP